MSPEAQLNDKDLTFQQVAALESADEVVHFFAFLGYKVDEAIDLAPASFGIESDELRHQIRRIKKIATDPREEEIEVYLFELRSVTVTTTQAIVRQFRRRGGSHLLVLTDGDYERLDFVLVDRVRKEGSQPLDTQPKYILRPRILSLYRHRRTERDEIALRVLRRFTFTEIDGLAQWEKLRSAYTLAEWSEPNFNNRALFSDYYLNRRLTDPKLTPEWGEDAAPAGRKVLGLLADARQKFTGKTEQVVREELIEPLFTFLGFDFTPGQDAYRLYEPGRADHPVALALTYVWNRNLDDSDPQRNPETPDEIPGAKVVTLLENGEAPWVIVTNGKLWRLYSTTASNKATNYYEVDLEEALFAPQKDQVIAFKYWWLMFRRPAFTGFLDGLLTKSADYAQELRERLKNRVFESIFPYFAEGFIINMRQQGAADIDLETTFTGTMTFLYRLMFVLYAESLELLPVKEEQGYGASSLYMLKNEIAQDGGTLEDEAPGRLDAHYNELETGLYERLQTLFRQIDRGAPEVNLPVYNGGLFSPITESGAFLEQYAIPDVYLALGLDRLARDIDSKTGDLVMIDFKSLGVRQLGSIYEGLLEFKLRIADKKLAVIKEKNREVYVPYAQAKGRIIAELDPGAVYLENTRQERKATGSYYTPDYIVKYIVEHTVGPVLQVKFEALAPRLRQAQKEYQQHRKLALAKKEDPAKFWNSEAMQRLAVDCLDIRVLDPAMGSGHFLVEAVDFVSNRLIDFLNAWSDNPVWAMLEHTRQDILEEMERQGVSIDAGKLTRVALLKRAVLKRCVYGVDLNLMAVELAKVSLWLDAFTLGAPLSFLDHHLKWGNSLIGARINEVREALEGSQTLFSQNKFAGVMLATDLMRQVSYLSDNTVSQARQSAEAFRHASDHLAPYRRVLDVYTSRWFGNAPTSGKRGAMIFDPTVEFLRRDDTQKWLEDPYNPKNRLPADDYMKAGLVAKSALKAAKEKHFFHWELEFPEVFFAPSTPGGQDVRLREDGGFDAVVGNPPYFSISSLPNDAQEHLKGAYPEIYSGNSDILYYFLALVDKLPKPTGILGLIVARYFQESKYAYPLRKYLTENFKVAHFVDFRNFQIFGRDVNVLESLVFLVSKYHPGDEFTFLWLRDDTLPENIVSRGLFDPTYNIFEIGRNYLPIGGAPWFFKGGIDGLDSKIEEQSIELNELATVVQSMQTGRNAVLAPSRRIITEYNIEPKLLHPIAKSGSVLRYEFEPVDTILIWTEGIELDKYPNAKRYLSQFREDLATRYDIQKRNANWYGISNPRSADLFFGSNPRILVPFVATGNKFCVDDSLHLNDGGDLRAIFFNKNAPYSEYFVCSVLNSNLMDGYHKRHTKLKRGGYYEYFEGQLSKLPIPRIAFTTTTSERNQLVGNSIALYDATDEVGVLELVVNCLAQNNTDVVHDLLAHLARQMIELNKQKQAEVSRFLEWLEDSLKIASRSDGTGGLESLAGRTYIQSYLGDYRKGELETDFDLIYDKLYDNHRRFGVRLTEVKGQIEAEYERSLQILLPIKRRLQYTDTLIDRIIYQLYRLTEEEIRLIEEPQYEQAVVKAKEEVLANKDIKPGSDEALSAIGDKLEAAARRIVTIVEPVPAEAQLDRDYPAWTGLSERARTFLLSAEMDYLAENRAEYTGSVVNYAKVVEVTLNERLFLPFRAAGYTDNDVVNEVAFKPFMLGKKKTIMLGSMEYVLVSGERTFREFVVRELYHNALNTIFSKQGLRALMTQEQVQRRNAAAHEGVMSHDDAGEAREWTLAVLSFL